MARSAAVLLVVFLAVGCSSQEVATEPMWLPAEDAGPPSDPRQDGGRGLPSTPRPVPDTVVVAEDPPPPIAGGTLLTVGSRAFAADPDHDRVWLVELYTNVPLTGPTGRDWPLAGHAPGGVTGEVVLEPGDEPGRMAATPSDVWVILRGAGAIGRLDVETSSVAERIQVCAAPRGIAYHAELDAMLVACVGGGLRIVPLDGSAQRALPIGSDLRDVVVTAAGVWVSRFRKAEVIQLDHAVTRALRRFAPLPVSAPGGAALGSMAAWRMVGTPGGGILVSHQLATSTEHPVSVESPGGYGGGGDPCAPAIVTSAITSVSSVGEVRTSGSTGSVLPVDVAVHGERVVQIYAGARNDGSDFTPAWSSLPLDASGVGCAAAGEAYVDGRQVIAVAFDDLGAPVFQTRDPWGISSRYGEYPFDVQSRKDTGHDLFHENAGAGIACASCHLEGGEDGRTWAFEGIGPRRTQDLRGGIAGSEPFHWSGDMGTFATLAHEVFHTRMGGPDLPEAHTRAMLGWIDSLAHPAREAPDDPAAVERGHAIFESREVGCTSCHAGPRLSAPDSFVVRRGDDPFQVPSLRGVVLRAPYMHDGCAETLHDRFDPRCGGDLHGNTASLTAAQVGDLVAYLETL